MSANTQAITQHPAGSFRELISIQFPLFLSLLSGSLMGFCDRLFLARYSLEAFEAISYAIYICMIFQVGCMRITTPSQILIGHVAGSQKKQRVGEYTWQMIWFSLATMIVTLPISSIFGSYFFSAKEISLVGKTYFSWMMYFNFLFPLGTTLATFFIGLGKTRVITYATLVSHSFNILLNYSLIFGISGLIPPLGAIGAAVATGTSQVIYCSLLFAEFIRGKYHEYGCLRLRLKLQSLFEILRLGLPTAAARMHNLFVWSLMMKILADQGEGYLLALSYGSMLSFLFSPLNESSTQSLITLFSYYLGAARKQICRKILLKAHIVALVNLLVVTSILFFFGAQLIENFSTATFNPEALTMLKSSTLALCVYFAVESTLFIGFSWAMAQKRILHVMITGMGCTLIFGYLGFHVIFTLIGCPPKYTWWAITAQLVPSIPLYYAKWKITRSLDARSLTQ